MGKEGKKSIQVEEALFNLITDLNLGYFYLFNAN